MKFGRNQLMLIGAFAVTMLFGLVFVFSGQATAKEWFDWSVYFVPAMTGMATGFGAATKILKKRDD